MPLPTPDGPVMTKTLDTASSGASMETSSVRWRCERPPIVFDGEMRQCWRTLLTFTRPYLGTARSMSNTLAVSTNSGGLQEQVMDALATGLEIPLQLRTPRADLVRPLQGLHALDEGALGGSH